MIDSDSRALSMFLDMEGTDANRPAPVFDVWVVADIDGAEITAYPVHEPDTEPRPVMALAGLQLGLGDEVLVGSVGGRPVVIGATRTASVGFSLLQATPIILPTHRRTGPATWSGTTDFSSLRVTYSDLDPGYAYLVSATVGAYIGSDSGSTKVGMGVRIGFASDPDSTGTPEWGSGHFSTTPIWATASFQRVISSATAIQVTGRGYATAPGTFDIGDGHLDITITPLYTAGRI